MLTPKKPSLRNISIHSLKPLSGLKRNLVHRSSYGGCVNNTKKGTEYNPEKVLTPKTYIPRTLENTAMYWDLCGFQYNPTFCFYSYEDELF